MTKSLMDAVALAAEQPEESQEQIAAVIREELASERAWERRFSSTTELLDTLADEADRAALEGRTTPLEFDDK